jgi:hypothetical protein
VTRVGCWMLALLLALPAARGDEPPKDAKKPPSAQERYDTLLKDFDTQQREIITEARKAEGPDRQKLLEKYQALGKDFAEKFYKLAEDNPKDPVATDALFWVMQNGTGSSVYQKAADKVTALIGEVPLSDLTDRLNGLRGVNPKIMDAVLKRAEKEEKDPGAADLLAWVATNGYNLPAGRKAIDRLVEKYPDHAAIEQLCMTLTRRGAPKAEDTLKRILEKSSKPKVQAAAALALGQALAAKTDTLGDRPAEADKVAAEAEKYLTRAIDLLGQGDAARQKQAEIELKALRTLRVGKEAPEISAGDLDGKEFKLSDYRGKVVLLDFWGNW